MNCNHYIFSFLLVNAYTHIFFAESTVAADQPVLSESTSLEMEVEVEVEVEVDTGNDESQVIPLVEHEEEIVSENGTIAIENGHAEENNVVESPVDSSQDTAHSVIERAASNVQEDAPKKSFASVVSYCSSITKISWGYHMDFISYSFFLFLT